MPFYVDCEIQWTLVFGKELTGQKHLAWLHAEVVIAGRSRLLPSPLWRGLPPGL